MVNLEPDMQISKNEMVRLLNATQYRPAADFLVEVDAIGGNQHREDNPQLDQQPQPAALTTGCGLWPDGEP
jgi:hypothetical protein